MSQREIRNTRVLIEQLSRVAFTAPVDLPEDIERLHVYGPGGRRVFSVAEVFSWVDESPELEFDAWLEQVYVRAFEAGRVVTNDLGRMLPAHEVIRTVMFRSRPDDASGIVDELVEYRNPHEPRQADDDSCDDDLRAIEARIRELAREVVERHRMGAIVEAQPVPQRWNNAHQSPMADMARAMLGLDVDEAQRLLDEQRADEMREELGEAATRIEPSGNAFRWRRSHHFQGYQPGRYAVQREAAIGGWITIQDRDSYPNPTAAIYSAQAAGETHDYPTRVVDKNTREVVWPKEMEGERL